MRESEIQYRIRAELGARDDLVLFRNHVGVATHIGGGDRTVKLGLGKGSSDLVGCLKPSGRWVCLEVKGPGKKLTREQEMWLDMMRSFGAFAARVESVRQATEAIDRAHAGFSK